MKNLDAAGLAREVSSHRDGGIEGMVRDGRDKHGNSQRRPRSGARGERARSSLRVPHCRAETQQVPLGLRQAAIACARPRRAVCGATREDLDQPDEEAASECPACRGRARLRRRDRLDDSGSRPGRSADRRDRSRGPARDHPGRRARPGPRAPAHGDRPRDARYPEAEAHAGSGSAARDATPRPRLPLRPRSPRPRNPRPRSRTPARASAAALPRSAATRASASGARRTRRATTASASSAGASRLNPKMRLHRSGGAAGARGCATTTARRRGTTRASSTPSRVRRRRPGCRTSSSGSSGCRRSCCRSTRRRGSSTGSAGRCWRRSTRSRPTTAAT